MEAGTVYHEAFGRRLRLNRTVRRALWVLLLLVLTAAAALVIWRMGA